MRRLKLRAIQTLLAVHALFICLPIFAAPSAAQDQALRVLSGNDLNVKLPSLCKVSGFDGLKRPYFQFMEQHPGARSFYQPGAPGSQELWNLRSQSVEHLNQKKDYAFGFLEQFKLNPEVQKQCCQDNRACQEKLSQARVVFDSRDRSEFKPEENVIHYSESGLIGDNLFEEIEYTLIHEMGHACDLAYRFGQTGQIETGVTKADTVRDVIGADFLRCLHEEDYSISDDGMNRKIEGYWSRFFGWGLIYTEAFAEAVFSSYLNTPWHWTAHIGTKTHAGYAMGTRCLFKIERLHSRMCR